MKNLFILLISIFFFSTSNAVSKYAGRYINGIYFAKHPALSKKKGVLIMSHGIMSHSEGYLPFIKQLNQQGYTVYRYDLRAHGLSMGEPRIHIDNFDEYFNDLNNIINIAKAENKATPIYLFGHSLGGLITYLYVTNNPQESIAGIILSAPSINVPLSLWEEVLLFSAKKLVSILPKQYVYIDIDPNELTDDPQIVKQLKNDLLRGNNLTIKIGLEMYYSSLEAQKRIFADTPTPPLLLIQGNADKRVKAKSNIGFATYAKSINRPVTILPLEGVRHEPLKSKKESRMKVQNSIIDFMNKN